MRKQKKEKVDELRFNAFCKLVEDQFVYGGKKYALQEMRESTDVLFTRYGKNWLLGTIDKYYFRFKNLRRERDQLKIATYMYIIWLKRGFHIMDSGINDPVIETNQKNKKTNFKHFIKEVKKYYTTCIGKMTMDEESIDYFMEDVSDRVNIAGHAEWRDIKSFDLYRIFDTVFTVWNTLYGKNIKHDTDTWNEKKK